MESKQNFEGAQSSGHPTVLHVDDDPNDVELMRAAARKADAAIVLKSVSDVTGAIKYLEQILKNGSACEHAMPRLILLDLHLPQATGLEFLSWVQARPMLRNIPVVVLSGSESHAEIHQAYAAGAASYFVKPMGLDPLVAMVSEISDRWCNPGLHA